MSSSHKKMVFVDVDTQADFMFPSGKLYVPGAEKIIANLERLMEFALEQNVPVISSADAHTSDDPEFQQFPPHCVNGTPGQEKIRETLLARHTVLSNEKHPLPTGEVSQYQQWILEKQKFDLFTNVNASALIESFGADQFVTFGVATEYCVKAAVLGLLHLGRPVALVVDAIEGIDRASSEAALREMEAAGAKLITTDQVVSQVKAA